DHDLTDELGGEVKDVVNDLTFLLVEDAALITEGNDVPQFVLAIDHRVSESGFEPKKIEQGLTDKIQEQNERLEELVEKLQGAGDCDCDVEDPVERQGLGRYLAEHYSEHRHRRKCCEDGNGMSGQQRSQLAGDQAGEQGYKYRVS